MRTEVPFPEPILDKRKKRRKPSMAVDAERRGPLRLAGRQASSDRWIPDQWEICLKKQGERRLRNGTALSCRLRTLILPLGYQFIEGFMSDRHCTGNMWHLLWSHLLAQSLWALCWLMEGQSRDVCNGVSAKLGFSAHISGWPLPSVFCRVAWSGRATLAEGSYRTQQCVVW